MEPLKPEIDPVKMEQARKRLFAAVERVDEQTKSAFVLPRQRHPFQWAVAAAFIPTVALAFVFTKYTDTRRAASERETVADRQISMLKKDAEDLRHSLIFSSAKLPPASPLAGTEFDAERRTLIERASSAEGLVESQRKEFTSLQANLEDLRSQVQVMKSLLDSRTADRDKAVAERDRAVTERDALSAKFLKVSRDLETSQTALDAALHRGRSDDSRRVASLETQISDLKNSLDQKEREFDTTRSLLNTDRDIRNLMSARNLHIVDVHDLDFSGHTKKPFGRVFYTEGKSLIFYAYDLDKHQGARRSDTFQAWGFREGERQTATKLGMFYTDNQNQNSWVLKFDDPKTLANIDAVFVTIEPPGGSEKPSGKRLLYAFLTGKANHP